MLSYYVGRGIVLAGGFFIRKFDSGKQLKYSVPLVLCAALIFCPWPLIGSYKLQNNILRWNPTECRIINSTTGIQRSRHFQEMTVEYKVNQTLIQSTTNVCRWSSIHAFNRCIEIYPDNSTFTCIYDPDDPTSVDSFSDDLRVLISKFALSVEIFTLFPVMLVFVLSWQSLRALLAVIWFFILVLISPILRGYFKISNPDTIGSTLVETSRSTKSYSEWFLLFRSLWNIACGFPNAKVAQNESELTKLFPMSNDREMTPEDLHQEINPESPGQEIVLLEPLEPDESKSFELELSDEDFAEDPLNEHSLSQRNSRSPPNCTVEQFKVQFSIMDRFSKFCTPALVSDEQILWVAEPFIFNQVLSVEYLLKWLFGFLMTAFMYYSFYVGLLFGIEVPADYIALYTGYSIFLVMFLPGILWELIEPWFMRSCYIVTNKRMAKLTLFSLGDIPWRREVLQFDSILEDRGVFVRPRRWDVFDVEVQCSSAKGWFMFKDLDLEDMKNLKSALRRKWKSHP